ncbi:hypothetical protein [Thalassoporum mexicanum]
MKETGKTVVVPEDYLQFQSPCGVVGLKDAPINFAVLDETASFSPLAG